MWNDGPPPVKDDGTLILVILKDEFITPDCKPFEYYGDPIAVHCWSSKLKTTIDAVRLEYDMVKYWKQIGPYPHKAKRLEEKPQ